MKLMPLDRAAAEGIAFSHLTLLVYKCREHYYRIGAAQTFSGTKPTINSTKISLYPVS